MTEHFRTVSSENSRMSKILVGLFSALLAFIVVALGWQQWLYTEQRREMRDMIIRQDSQIVDLRTGHETLWKRTDELIVQNGEQDRRMAKDYVTLERYSCDLKELKDTMKDGFQRITLQMRDFHSLPVRK